jgi:hypothetical protein
MTGNQVAKLVALSELKRLEQAWRKQMEGVLKMGLSSPDAVASIQEMTVVQGTLCRVIIELEKETK